MDRPRPAARPNSGGRDDCWSEGATATLIEAWGDRYLDLNRGNLRQKDWKEVADAVNSRDNGVKPYKTDVQCKNRIDTLKKKYKLEKSKPTPSAWAFYPRLDFLIGSSSSSNKKPNTTVTLTIKSAKPSAGPGPGPKPSAVRSPESDDDDEDDDGVGLGGRAVVRKHRMEALELSDEAACRELARAILKFGEIYERIESSKQQKLMELERQRMEFAKDLEFQRLNMFMDAQLELEKVKRAKYTPGSGK